MPVPLPIYLTIIFEQLFDARQCTTMRRGTCLQTNRLEMQRGRNDNKWRHWGLLTLNFPLWGFASTSVLILTTLGKGGFDCECIVSIYTRAFDLGRHMRNWLFIHRVTLALSLTTLTIRSLLLQLSRFQGQGCDRGQHAFIRDRKVIWSTVFIISWKCLFFSKCSTVHMLFSLPLMSNSFSSLEITCPSRLSLNITLDVKPSRISYMSQDMDSHPTYHLARLHKHLLETSLRHSSLLLRL